MKWKTIAVVAVLAALVAALVAVGMYAFQDKAVRDTKKRIATYRLVAEEQKLIRSILEDKIAVSKIQAQLAPKEPPVVPKVEPPVP